MFVVVLGVVSAVVTRDELRCFVGFETELELSMQLGLFGIADSLIGKHEVVMRFEVFGVDAKGLLKLFDRSLELPFQEMETPDLVPHDAVFRIRLRGPPKMGEGFVVEPLGLKRQSIEVVSFGQVGCAA